jgi:transcriptional regulator with XRE-family HTH domain
MQYAMNDKLKKIIEVSSLTQKDIATKLGTNQIHLNKVLNGKANLTTRMAKKLATISELKTSEQDLIYPSLPLDIAGYYYTGLKVVPFKTSRPQLYVPTPINPNYFGVIYRGQSYENSKFHLPLNDGECMVFDGSFEKLKIIDPDAIGKLSIIENEKGELWCGWLDEMGKQSKKHNFNPLGSTAWVHFKVKWASTFVMAWNLCKLEGVDNLVQLD